MELLSQIHLVKNRNFL